MVDQAFLQRLQSYDVRIFLEESYEIWNSGMKWKGKQTQILDKNRDIKSKNLFLKVIFRFAKS